MIKKTLTLIAVLAAALTSAAQVKVSVHETAKDQPVIPAEIYGQFSEHLGKCIYEGIWVGKDSSIPNVNGYRTDVLEAFRALKVPVLRWPGGCFGDEYHWMDGIGPQENRKKLVNNNWGSTVEDNSFGTHEFLNLCEMLGIEPYISGNVGSGTVEELAKWVEYMTAKEGSMAELRAKNGRKEPWKVKYLQPHLQGRLRRLRLRLQLDEGHDAEGRVQDGRPLPALLHLQGLDGQQGFRHAVHPGRVLQRPREDLRDRRGHQEPLRHHGRL